MAATIFTEELASAVDLWLEHHFIRGWVKTRPYLALMDKWGRTVDGGPNLAVPAGVYSPQNIGATANVRADITLATATTIKAYYPWSYYEGRTGLDGKERNEIKDPVAQLDLLQERSVDAIEEIAEQVSIDLFAKVTNTANAGVLAFYDMYTKRTTSATVGGIACNEGVWSVQGTPTTHATDPLSGVKILSDLNADTRTLMKSGGRANLCLMSDTAYGLFIDAIQDKAIYRPDDEMVLAGYQAFQLLGPNGAKIVFEPHMFEDAHTVTNGNVWAWYILMEVDKNYLVRSGAKPQMIYFPPTTNTLEGYILFYPCSQVFGALNRVLVHEYKLVTA